MLFCRRNFALIRIYYAKLNSLEFKEQAGYVWSQLAADVGSIAGIFLGISALSVFEFLHCVVGLALHAATQGKQSIL